MPKPIPRKKVPRETRTNFSLAEENAKASFGKDGGGILLPQGERSTRKRYSKVFGTDEKVKGAKYIGTTRVGNKETVWHVDRREKEGKLGDRKKKS